MSRYIDADKLVKECLSSLTICPGFEMKYIEAMYDRIRNAPAVDVADVKHGKWDENLIGFCNVCLECGAIVERCAIKNNSGKLNFCPNCGAKMDGKENNNG